MSVRSKLFGHVRRGICPRSGSIGKCRNRGTGPENNKGPPSLGEVNRRPQFYGAVEGDGNVWRWSVARSIYLLISGGRYFKERAPSSIHRDFLKNFGKPRAAVAAGGSPRARGVTHSLFTAKCLLKAARATLPCSAGVFTARSEMMAGKIYEPYPKRIPEFNAPEQISAPASCCVTPSPCRCTADHRKRMSH